MKVSIHQPNYLPGISYFHKLSQADLHIFLDDVQYSKNDFINRNKILCNKRPFFLTIPISKKATTLPINKVKMPADLFWIKKHKKTIHQSYSKAPFYRPLGGELLQLLDLKSSSLANFNISIIKFLSNALKINCKYTTSSSLGIDVSATKTQRLICLLQATNATEYICGQGSKTYIDDDMFSKANIKLSWSNFKATPYPQPEKTFFPNLSVIDLFFREGPQSVHYI